MYAFQPKWLLILFMNFFFHILFIAQHTTPHIAFPPFICSLKGKESAN